LRNTFSILGIFMIILILFTLCQNIAIVRADDEVYQVELFIVDDDDLVQVEYGVESTIRLHFKQSGFNWSYLREYFGYFWLDFIYAKFYLPIIFREFKDIMGYNSVNFIAEVIGNLSGWAAWVSPSSVTNFTGDSSVYLDLKLKVGRPSTVNTAKIRVKYIAFSGGNNLLGNGSTDVLVSISQYHLAEINASVQHKETSPEKIISFPIEVKNLGNYEDTFIFEVDNDSNGFLCLVSDQLTLKPNCSGNISAIVLTPDAFIYDFGTRALFNISAYSIYEPTKKFSTSISITSKGFLVTEMYLFSITIIISTTILLLIFFYYKFRFVKRRKNI